MVLLLISPEESIDQGYPKDARKARHARSKSNNNQLSEEEKQALESWPMVIKKRSKLHSERESSWPPVREKATAKS